MKSVMELFDERALAQVPLPSLEGVSSYAIRLVQKLLESNGSSL